MTKIERSDTEYKLSRREIETLRFVYTYMKKHPLHQAPSHQELLDHLNKVLPRQPDGSPALVSKQQTLRIADSLRAKGYIVKNQRVVGMARNMVPTPKGEAAIAELEESES